jgi:hypothetical protein
MPLRAGPSAFDCVPGAALPLRSSLMAWPYSCASQRYRRKWDREFESGLLQRGVCKLSVPRALPRSKVAS